MFDLSGYFHLFIVLSSMFPTFSDFIFYFQSSFTICNPFDYFARYQSFSTILNLPYSFSTIASCSYSLCPHLAISDLHLLFLAYPRDLWRIFNSILNPSCHFQPFLSPSQPSSIPFQLLSICYVFICPSAISSCSVLYPSVGDQINLPATFYSLVHVYR